MPNTLVHLGANGLALKWFVRREYLIWVYAGAVIPDLPWIMQRIFPLLAPHTDFYALRAYSLIQASLAFSLILSMILALCCQKTLRVFVILAVSCILHLLLDAAQTKWANGVHFLVPVDWVLVNWQLFWPESWLNTSLAGLGLLFVILHWASAIPRLTMVAMTGTGKVALMTLLILLYFCGPLAFMQKPFDADNHYLQTLLMQRERPGKPIELDRARYEIVNAVPTITAYTGERFRVQLLELASPATISVIGYFRTENTIHVLRYHESQFPRDYLTILGMLMIILLLLQGLVAQFKLKNF